LQGRRRARFPDGPVADDEAKGDFAANRRLDQAFVNTFWHFLPNAEAGLEYEFGRRETFDKQLERESRVTAVLHYDFL
jgi:hypothetical protein